MPKYWCVNFDFEACLRHGLHRKLWLMQYQYPDDQGNEFQGGRQQSATTQNWQRMEEIQEGDRLVAYLRGNRFFAVGAVIPSRWPMNHEDTIEDYVARKESHRYTTGRVQYTPVFYEDFSDNWRHPDYSLLRYAQRIDVQDWQQVVPEGVVVKGLGKLKRPELKMAAIRIKKSYFDRIEKALIAARDAVATFVPASADEAADEAAAEALEKDQAEGQGFVLDSRLRKALEDFAMDAAKQYFEGQGYQWEDHSKNHPYDLRCVRDTEVRYVEVKGTQTDGSEVFLTPGEVEFARGHKNQMALFVLHSIQVARGDDDEWVLSGGEHSPLLPWNLDGGNLKPVSYKYTLSD
jgi:hypothetical protein